MSSAQELKTLANSTPLVMLISRDTFIDGIEGYVMSYAMSIVRQ